MLFGGSRWDGTPVAPCRCARGESRMRAEEKDRRAHCAVSFDRPRCIQHGDRVPVILHEATNAAKDPPIPRCRFAGPDLLGAEQLATC